MRSVESLLRLATSSPLIRAAKTRSDGLLCHIPQLHKIFFSKLRLCDLKDERLRLFKDIENLVFKTTLVYPVMASKYYLKKISGVRASDME